MRFLSVCLLGLVAGLASGRDAELFSAEFPALVVDLSHHNARVDFALLREAGVVGVIHKATQGVGYVDPKYKSRRAEAERAGLLWGAYHFGTGVKPGATQADHFLNTVGDWDKVLLVLDLEENRQGKSMSAVEAEAFVQRIVSRARRYPVLYGGPYYLQGMTMGPGLRSCRLWVSHYTSASRPMIPRPWNFWALWQYTDGKLGGNPKSVSGVGNCDINRFNGTESQLRKRWPDLNSEDL